MIHLHIKGNINAALFGASKHGVELNLIQCQWRHGIAECFASADHKHEPNVRNWFHEDADIIDGYGYPAGTLLHFTHIE